MNLELLAAAANMLRSCLYDATPAPFSKDNHYEIVYQRVVEIQAEQCDAIYYLYQAGLFRPAYAILRSVLEAMGTLIWISLSIDRYCPLFEEGKQPNTKEILTRISWENEYSRTFQYLSGFTHIEFDNAEFYRNYEFGDDPSKPFPEIEPDGEYYVIDTNNGLRTLSIHLMSKDEAAHEYGPYLSAKTFDLVVAGLEKLYGSDLYQKDWWQQEAAISFMKLCANNPKIANRMLWSSQQRLF